MEFFGPVWAACPPLSFDCGDNRLFDNHAGQGVDSTWCGRRGNQVCVKDVFENFLAGILLLFRDPFSIGDYIDCKSIEGQVEEITIRDTRIRQTDGQLVVAPSAMLFKNPVTIRTAKLVRGVDKVRDDVRDVENSAQEFADSEINFEVTWWTESRPIDIRSSRDKVLAAVKSALDDVGIEIPFPYRTLTFKETLPLTRGTAACKEDSSSGSAENQTRTASQDEV